MDTASDQSLMIAVREGDVAKLGILFERYNAPLFAFLYRLTGNRHLSEDLVQEVFVRMLKYRHTYRGESRFTTWMFQIARNARVDHFRRNATDDQNEELEGRDHVSLMPGPAERAERSEEMRILREAMARLPVDKRELLLLKGFQGLTFEEIARVLNCSANTLKGRAMRAIADLRIMVQELTGEKVS